MGVFDGAAGAAISAVGGLGAGYMNYSSAQDMMAFQEKAYKHRYQWAMDDMRKAGLNPIFAYKGIGTGAPAGASANFNNPFAGVPSMISSSVQKKTADSVIQKNFDQAGAANAQDTLMRRQWKLLRDQHPWLVMEAKANANAAKAMADTLQSQKLLQKHDAKFWLDNPEMRNFSNFLQGFNPLVPRTGANVNVKGGK